MLVKGARDQKFTAGERPIENILLKEIIFFFLTIESYQLFPSYYPHKISRSLHHQVVLCVTLQIGKILYLIRKYSIAQHEEVRLKLGFQTGDIKRKHFSDEIWASYLIPIWRQFFLDCALYPFRYSCLGSRSCSCEN